MIGEISSISLDHNLKFSDGSNINGEFIVSGSYRLTEASRLEDEFSFKIPVEIILNEVLDLDDAKIEIEDFKYHVENDDTLVCHIEVKVEGVEEVTLEEESEKEEIEVLTDLDDVSLITDKVEEVSQMSKEDNKDSIVGAVLERECDGDMKIDVHNQENEIKDIEIEEDKQVENTVTNDVGSLFSSLGDADETYATYSVYILRENDTIESIMNKYKVTREELENYNDLNNLNVGSKIIIPTADEKD